MNKKHENPITTAVRHNEHYTRIHGVRALPTIPAKHLAIITCMDSRLDIFGALGLELGQAHIIRNAGGIATDDVVRSLILSQRLPGTTSIMLIHHTRCGLEGLNEAALRAEIENDTGTPQALHFGAFTDVVADVKITAARLNAEPALQHTELRL